MTGETIESHCARCLRPAPPVDDLEDDDWEALGPEGTLLVCPDCITPEEQQAVDESDMELTDELSHCARCLRPTPAADDPEYDDWEVLAGEGSFVCPGCITAEERQVLENTNGDD